MGPGPEGGESAVTGIERSEQHGLRRPQERAAGPGSRQGLPGRRREPARRHREALAAAGGRDQHLGRACAGRRVQRRAGPGSRLPLQEEIRPGREFVLLEDPAAQLAAFRNGRRRPSWEHLDTGRGRPRSWPSRIRRPSRSSCRTGPAAATGRLAVVHQTVEQLKGKKVACTQFTPSHFLLLYLLAQSGLSPEDRPPSKKASSSRRRARRRRDVQGLASSTRPCVGARPVVGRDGAAENEAHILVCDDRGDQHHRRHAVRPAEPARPGARNGARLVRGWFDGIEMIKKDPAGAYAVSRRPSSWTPRRSRGCCPASSSRRSPTTRSFTAWRAAGPTTRRSSTQRSSSSQEGPRHARGRREGWADTRFLSAGGVALSGEAWRSRRSWQGAFGSRPGISTSRSRSLYAGLGRDHAGLVLVSWTASGTR